MSDVLLDLPSHLRDRLVSALESSLLGPSPTLASLRSVLGNREDVEDLAARVHNLGKPYRGCLGPKYRARCSDSRPCIRFGCRWLFPELD